MPKVRCDAHLYKRVKRKKGDMYKCQRCPHYCTEVNVIGQTAECWYCNKLFLMTVKSLLHKPQCGCRAGTKPWKSKNKEKSSTVQMARNAVFENLMKKLG